MNKALNISNIVLLACFGVLVFVLSNTVFSDYDFWWHARKGETIAMTGSIANPDSFSYTFEGEPDVNAEWLADFIIYQSYNLGGLFGANLLKAILLLATFLFILGTMKSLSNKKGYWLIAGIASVVLILFAIRFRLHMRPFIFSYLYFASFIFLLVRHSKSGDIKYLYLLPIIQLLWTNSSKAAFFGLAIIGVYGLAALVSRKLTIKLVLVGLAALVAFCINPDGPLQYLDIFNQVNDTHADNMFFSVGEHQSLSTSLLWGRGLHYTWGFQLILLCGLIELAFFKGYRKYFLFFLFILFLMPTSIIIRLISFFCLAAAGLFYLFIERIFSLIPAASDKLKVYMNLTVSLLLLVLAFTSSISDTYTYGARPKTDTFPEEALNFLDENEVQGTMFNSYSIGGYSLWKAPHRKVFIDGRAGHVYSQEFFSQYMEMLRHPSTWDRVAEEWAFDYALLEYDIKDGGKHFPFHINDNVDWALVYWDNQSAVYLKRTPQNLKIIARNEYKIAKPNKNDFTYMDKFRGAPNKLLEADKQLRREIEINPNNQEPILARAYFLLNNGNESGTAVGIEELKRCLAMKPNLPMEHSAYARILMDQGDMAEAKIQVDKALSINPYEEVALKLREKLE